MLRISARTRTTSHISQVSAAGPVGRDSVFHSGHAGLSRQTGRAWGGRRLLESGVSERRCIDFSPAQDTTTRAQPGAACSAGHIIQRLQAFRGEPKVLPQSL
eukprot:4293078-Prymnesium_polylepis.2